MKTIIDSGSDDSFISPEALARILPQPIIYPTNKDFQAMNGTKVFVSGYVILTIDFDKYLSRETIYVSPQTNIDLLLGQTWIKKHQAILNCKDQCVTIMANNGPKSIQYISTYDDNGGDPHQQYNIRLVQDVTIKPRTVQPVDAICPSISSADTVLFRPRQQLQEDLSILIPNSLLNIYHHRTTLYIVNHSNTDCVLPKNSKLGKVRHVPLTNLCCSVTESFESLKPEVVIPHKIVEDINMLIKHLEPEQQQLIRPILLQEWNVFDISKPSQATDLKTEHRIITQEHPPIYQRAYRVPESIKKQQKEITDEMERNGQISRSQSPWASPILLVKKHDGSPRFVVDYRKLNSITIRDSYPLPRMDDTINKLAGSKYYSKFDLKAGYHQIPIDCRDRHKTAFITSYGLFEFNVLPQGLINGPPVFQRIMGEVLGDLLGHHCLVYLDDIITFSGTIHDHVKDVHTVLHVLNKHNFKLNLSKCALFHGQIEYLGHEIDHRGYRPLKNNIRAVVDIPTPTTYEAAHRFYGMANYYRSFVKNFAKVAFPLQRFQPKKGEFIWKTEQQLAFDILKNQLVSEPCTLTFPVPNVPFMLATDASSKNGIGVTLKQKIDRNEHVIVYLSQNLNKVERKWGVTEQECWAIVWAVKKLRIYLYGTKFTVITDHHPLCWLNKHKSSNERLYRWSLALQEYDFDIKHKSGSCHLDADCLSRSISPNDATENHSINEHDEDNIPIHNEFRPIFQLNKTDISQINVVQTRAQKAALDDFSSTSAVTSKCQPTTILADSSDPPPPLGFDYTKISQEQSTDPTVQRRIREIQQHPNNYPSFVVEHDILYKLIDGYPGRTKKKIPWVPESMIKDLLYSAHTHLTSAHYGSDRTYYKLKDHYYWPNMLNDIKQYVRQCLLCAKYNIPRHKPPGLLETPAPPNEIFDLIGVDFWGPTRESTINGNRYIITCTDHLSKFVIAKAVPAATASEAAKFLVEDVIFRYGHIPKHILTDQGLHFNNKLIHVITNDIGINHIFSTAYHPQTNGIVERFNATIKSQLCKLQDSNQNNWDQYLLPTIYAYNVGRHRATKHSPYQLLYGRDPVLPFDKPQPMIQFGRSDDYYNQFRKYRSIIIQQVQKNIQQQQQLSKQRYDQHRQNIHYELGQLVLARPVVRNDKMQEIFEGPYRVISVLGPVTYEIQLEHSNYVRRVHVNIMKPIFEPQD
jgi:transposase InsO family protein